MVCPLIICSRKLHSSHFTRCMRTSSQQLYLYNNYQNPLVHQLYRTSRAAVGSYRTNVIDSKVHTSSYTSLEEHKNTPWVQAKVHLPFYKQKGLYLKLTKARLSALVTITATAGYLIAPGPFVLLPWIGATIGTFLCSCSANCFNQIIEVPYDCQMQRTRDRVLVKGLLRPLSAAYFGVTSGLLGFGILASTTNMPAAYLGLFNIFLYSGIYTPSKQIHIANTWIGAIVGAIPPTIGWVACTGRLDIGVFVIAGMLYSWQFPHFNALSWNYRPDYSRAGYRMMSVTDPALCRRVTLRHGIALIPLSIAACALHVTNWSFLALSLPVNSYLAFLSWKFYRNSNNNTARKLFRCTLWHLPLLMLFCVTCKYTCDSDDIWLTIVKRVYFAAKSMINESVEYLE